MKIGFIESVKQLKQQGGVLKDQSQKIKVASKRAYVMPNFDLSKDDKYGKRLSPVEAYKLYTKKILPQMEQNIELDMLQKQFQSIDNPIIKDDLIKSYLRRRMKLIQVDQQSMTDFKDADAAHEKTELMKLDVFNNIPLYEQNENNIGFYNEWPIKDIKKYFKSGFYGDYVEKEVQYTKRFCLMTTEEGLLISEYMKLINESFKNPIKYEETFKDLSKIQESLKDLNVYTKIFHDFSKCLIESLKPHRNNVVFERLFSSSSIFDMLIRIVILELEQILPLLSDNKKKQSIFDQIIKQIEEKADPLQSNPQYTYQFLETIKTLEIDLENGNTLNMDLLNYKQAVHQLPEGLQKEEFKRFLGFNSGILLHGIRGTGKSGVLGFLSMWAHDQKWIVISVPSGFNWTQKPKVIHRHHATGLFVQNEQAKEWLEHFKDANFEQLQTLNIKKEIYGKYNFSGVHDDETDPVPNIYYPKRKAYFKDHEKFLFDEEITLQKEEDKIKAVRLSEKLKSPNTLIELIEYGIQDEFYATNVLYEVLEQVYDQDEYCILSAVDGYNWFYKRSAYPSFRYANDKPLDQHVPPYHLSLCRAFIKFDGHLIKNGFKVCASSQKQLYKHTFNAQKIMMPPGYDVEMDGITLNDYRVMCEYYLQNNFWHTDEAGENSQEFFYMITQGNWFETYKYMRDHWHDTMIN